ncbi:MAG: auracyanin [Chloroflexales bacterium]|nr:auracyanin [Chloroflexales bacterium]
MKTNLRMLVLVALLGGSLVLSACGGGSGGATSGGGGAASSGPATIDIGSDGENLAFTKTTLAATAGQQVTINFKNNSAAQMHNWVLVNGGESVAAEIANAGLTAGVAADYLGADQSKVIAHVKVTNGGETNSVNFTAPAAGTYLYICTVPGHYPLMQGTMTVK